MIIPAPNSSRNSSQRSSTSTVSGTPTSSLPRKTARNPASSSSDSQPKPYQRCPTLTIDRYSSHSSSQTSTATGHGTTSVSPATTPADSATPAQARTAKNRSE